MSLVWPSLPFGDQTLDVVLDLAGLAGGLVVVGLLERLRRLRLDGRLDRGDEGLLVERPRLLGVHRVGLGRLGLRPDVTSGWQRRVLGLLGLRRRRRVRPLLPRGRLDLAGDRREGRVVLGAYAAGPDRRLQQCVRRQRRRRSHRGRVLRSAPCRTFHRRLCARPGLACGGSGLRRSPAERTDRRNLLRRGHRLLRGHGPWSEARGLHRERRCGRAYALQVHRYPGGLRRLEARLYGVGGRLVPTQLAQRAVDVGDRLVTGKTHPAGHQGLDRLIPRRSLQGQRRSRPRRKRSTMCTSPWPGARQRVVDLSLDGVGRLVSAGHDCEPGRSCPLLLRVPRKHHGHLDLRERASAAAPGRLQLPSDDRRCPPGCPLGQPGLPPAPSVGTFPRGQPRQILTARVLRFAEPRSQHADLPVPWGLRRGSCRGCAPARGCRDRGRRVRRPGRGGAVQHAHPGQQLDPVHQHVRRFRGRFLPGPVRLRLLQQRRRQLLRRPHRPERRQRPRSARRPGQGAGGQSDRHDRPAEGRRPRPGRRARRRQRRGHRPGRRQPVR